MSDDLNIIRHSTSHILAQAVMEIFPHVKLGIGPAIEDGFYYDFDITQNFTPEDLEKIENKMHEIIAKSQEFKQFFLNKAEALALVDKLNQPFKKEIIEDLDSNEYSFFQNDSFIDLCKGPHVKNTGEIKAFKLLKVSGAYWRGSEKNKMLQRIYGTAWNTEKELQDYLTFLEEAQKRDHRHLGTALDLFSVSEEVGAGLILWHPKGSRIRHIIEDYWKKAHFKNGYELLYTPHIGLSDLWKTSGHLDFYHENMYSSIDIDKKEYFLKPMNCPFHILIYQTKLHSYRDLPIRYAELGTVYRYERSGVLHGLLRVRGFTQDDAHLICTTEQMPSEIQKVVQFSINVLKKFGFDQFKIYLATKPTEKSVGDNEKWQSAEQALKNTLEELNLPYEIDEGGGAFYGPKIDIKIKDALNREWQCSTIQFDFNEPERFNMYYIDNEGKKTQPYMIHRALLGSIERFFGMLIEHYNGKFPFWLSPIQVKILTINDQITEYAEKIKEQLLEKEIRVSTDYSHEKIGAKIKNGIEEKIPFLIILGNKEKEANLLAIRSRDKGDLGQISFEEFLKLHN